MNNAIKKTAKKIPPPKEQARRILPRLESPKNENVQPPDLEIILILDFLTDSGAESNSINIPTWNEVQILPPTFSPSDLFSNLATARGTSSAIYGNPN